MLFRQKKNDSDFDFVDMIFDSIDDFSKLINLNVKSLKIVVDS